MKFHRDEKVRFNKNNFLYGKRGIIKNTIENKDGSRSYTVLVKIDEKDQEIQVKEQDLYKSWF